MKHLLVADNKDLLEYNKTEYSNIKRVVALRATISQANLDNDYAEYLADHLDTPVTLSAEESIKFLLDFLVATLDSCYSDLTLEVK